MQTALVFQGGGALGAYEVGVVQRLGEEKWFWPSLKIASGVSIGAINAALLAGGRHGPLATLQEAWRCFAMELPNLLPQSVQEVVASYGNPNFYMPRSDAANMILGTYLYEITPLRQLLVDLIDFKKLNSRQSPALSLSAVDVESGKLVSFTNRNKSYAMTVEHILASAALPPSFPMVEINGRHYWDGGVFSNTPLHEAIQSYRLGGKKILVVVNLFDGAGQLPTNWQEVGSRFLEILFSNKIGANVTVTQRYNDFVTTMDKIKTLCPNINKKLADDPGWQQLRRYDHIQSIVVMPSATDDEVMSGGHNFSASIIQKRMELGFQDADRALANDEALRQFIAAD